MRGEVLMAGQDVRLVDEGRDAGAPTTAPLQPREGEREQAA